MTSTPTPTITAYVGPWASGITSKLNTHIDEDALVITHNRNQQVQQAHEKTRALADLVKDLYGSMPVEKRTRVSITALRARLQHRRDEDPVAYELDRVLLDIDKQRPNAHEDLQDLVHECYGEIFVLLEDLGAVTYELQVLMLLEELGHAAGTGTAWYPGWRFGALKRFVVDDLQEYTHWEVELLIAWARETRTELVVALHPQGTLHDFIGADPVWTLDRLEAAGADVVEVAPENSTTLVEHETTDRNEVVRFVREAVSKGRSVAVLTVYRQEAAIQHQWIEDALKDPKNAEALPYPVTVALNNPVRPLETSFVHEKVLGHWDRIQESEPIEALDQITSLVLDDAVRASTRPADLPRLADLVAKTALSVRNGLEVLADGAMTQQEFFDELKDGLIRAEEKINAAALASAQEQNARIARVSTKAEVVVSTVHGVLGRRFDAVVMMPRLSRLDGSVLSSDWVEYGRSRADEALLSAKPEKPRRGM